MKILGVSGLYHDSAAVLLSDGNIVAAAQEERFTRKKHDAVLPRNAIEYCLKEGKCRADELDYVIFYDNPMLTLDRYMKNVLACGDDSRDLIEFGYDRIFSKKLWIHELLQSAIPSLGKNTKFLVAQHHISHASSAFYPSPFSQAIILVADGVGEWATLSIGIGNGAKLELKEELRYPNSLGFLYSAFSYFCGFKVNSGEYKFMGLAPYGKPVYVDLIRREIVKIKDDGSFSLNLKFFDFQNGRTMIKDKEFEKIFGGKRRLPESPITKREMDIAASVQLVTEEILLKIAHYAKKKYGNAIEYLVMAGGVALNCVANGRMLRESEFHDIWIQPAAGDAGGALGAAYYAYYSLSGKERNSDNRHDKQRGSYLGPNYGNQKIKEFLDQNHYRYHYHYAKEIPALVANLLCQQKIIGLFQGRMEFGPRALGNRSIIADPRSEDMQVRLNMKIKFRESFRPFAPSVLRERLTDYFDLDSDSPYMLLCAQVRKDRCIPFNLDDILNDTDMDMLQAVRVKRSDIPAVTHVDYSARIQTVDGFENPRYYEILKAFEALTGCGVVVNTSFNVRGEPIVCTPQDAYKCFMRSDMDVLVLEDYVLYKDEQEKSDVSDWKQEYMLD